MSLAACRARLLGIGAMTAPRLALAEGAAPMKAIVDDAVRTALEEISDGVIGLSGEQTTRVRTAITSRVSELPPENRTVTEATI